MKHLIMALQINMARQMLSCLTLVRIMAAQLWRYMLVVYAKAYSADIVINLWLGFGLYWRQKCNERETDTSCMYRKTCKGW